MKGKSPKGVAWANVVRSTLYTSSQPAEPKWKFSFRDYIESRGETFQIKGDFALAFRLFDNRELAKLIKDTATSDLSSFDTFHMSSSSKKGMKRIALLLDNDSAWDTDVITPDVHTVTFDAVMNATSYVTGVSFVEGIGGTSVNGRWGGEG